MGSRSEREREGGKYPLQKAQSPDIRWAAALQSSKLHLILRGGMVVVVGRVTGGGESRAGRKALSRSCRRGGERDRLRGVADGAAADETGASEREEGGGWGCKGRREHEVITRRRRRRALLGR